MAIQVNFNTQNLPGNASYRIAATVNGLTQVHDLHHRRCRAFGYERLFHNSLGNFLASAGTNQVIVTIDPDGSVALASSTGTSVSFTFNAVSVANPYTAYTAAQIRTAYGVNSIAGIGSAAADGTGQTVAIVIGQDDLSIFTDLDAFDQVMSLTTSSTETLYQQYGAASSFLQVYNQYGTNITSLIGNPGSGSEPNEVPTAGDELEISLDVEWVHAIAPGAKIDLVIADTDILTAEASAANLPGVSVVSNSWTGGDNAGETAYDATGSDPTFATPAGHSGVTFLAGLGDGGGPAELIPGISPDVSGRG